ncbi:MAG: chloramphenicol phosphotransferase CPT family protein [Thermotogota bacterium]
MNKGHIIFLNGISSSGKTTLAKELFKKLPDYFHVGLDNFDNFIDSMEDRKNKRLIPVETEYFFHRNIAMFSDEEVDLIVDHVLSDEFTKNDFFEVFSDYPVLYVGVYCPLEELIRREKLRGDRPKGLAEQQYDFVHKGIEYDVEVNTFYENTEECVNKIIDKFQLN